MDLRDLVDPAELIGVVRALAFPRFALQDVLPARTVEAVDYSILSGSADTNAAASVRAFDAPAPIGTRPGVQRKSGQLPPISQKIPLTEGDRLMLENLRRSAESEPLINAIFDDAARMARAVQARVELARGDALTDGIITINENGMQFTIDFGVPAGHKVAAAVAWGPAAPAAGVVLADVRSWVDTYVDTNGGPPGAALASTRVIGFMLANIGEGDPLFTRADMNAVLVAADLPPVEPYDVQVHDSGGTKVRVLPNDRFIMLPGEDDGRLGETQFGITVEAMELAQQNNIEFSEAAGVVAVVWKTEDPVQVWTKGAAIALPVFHNPELLFTADVD